MSRLDEIKARAEAATQGPWARAGVTGADVTTDASATALMLARAVAPDSPDEGALATA